MSLVNIISAIGNNSSIYPLLVRDCGIEIPVKVGMTYQQNLKDSKQMAKNAVRERLIDEYGTSAIWLGGIPLMDYLCDLGIKKLGYNPNINPDLFKETTQQGIKKNIDLFKDKAPNEVKELEKVLKNRKTYERLLAGKFILSTAIPVLLMGFVLPKMNFALTENIRQKQLVQRKESANTNNKPNTQKEKPTFKGGFIPALANMSTVNKMAVTDGGLTVGRVATARNKYEKMEMAFKMSGMMFLNFLAPIWIAKFLDSASNKIFNTNVNLDPKILNNENFVSAIKNNTLKLPEKGKIIDFLDKNPKSMFTELVTKFCGVKYLENGVRDPRSFVNEGKILAFQKEIEKFMKQAKESENIENFAKKALRVKSLNILTNVAISSFLLAIGLPKLTFYLRKLVTGSDAEPGLVGNNK